MSNVVKFDASSSDAWIRKSVPADSGYTVTCDVYIPTGTEVALASTFTADFIRMNTTGSIYSQTVFTSSDWTWATERGAGVDGGPTTINAWDSLQVVLTFSSGTTWLVDWTAEGTLVDNDTQNLGHNASAPMLFQFGALAASHVAGEIYYFRNIVIKDHTGTVVFSDDFSGGDLSNWDTVTGAASVVDGSVLTGGGGGGGPGTNFPTFPPGAAFSLN